MRRDDKRSVRQLKRQIKRAGTKHRRQQLKRELAVNPEEAPYREADVGRYRSSHFNGMDEDATRRPSTSRGQE